METLPRPMVKIPDPNLLWVCPTIEQDILSLAYKGISIFNFDFFLPFASARRADYYQESIEKLKRISSKGFWDFCVLGRFNRLMGSPKEAIINFELAEKIDPGHPWVDALKGECLLSDDIPAALNYLNRAIKVEEHNIYFRLWRSYAYMISGKWELADLDLSIIERTEPRLEVAWILGIIVKMKLRLWDAAKEKILIAKNLNPWSPGLWVMEAEVLWRLGSKSLAIDAAYEAIYRGCNILDGFLRIILLEEKINISDRPIDSIQLIKIVSRFISKNSYVEWAYIVVHDLVFYHSFISVSKYHRIDFQLRSLNVVPRRAWHYALAARMASVPRKERAGYDLFSYGERYIEEAVRLAPHCGWMRAFRSQVLRRKMDATSALEDLNEAVRLDKDYALSYYWRARLENSQMKFLEAKKDLDSSLSMKVNALFFHERAIHEKALALWGLGQRQSSFEELEKCVMSSVKYSLSYSGDDDLVRTGSMSIYGDDSSSLRNLKNLNRRIHKGLASPFPVWGLPLNKERLLEHFPAWLGRRYLNENQLNEARVEFLHALKRNSQNSLVWTWLGESYYRDGQYERAIESLNCAIKISPQFMLPRLWRGKALFYSGRQKEAYSDFIEAVWRDFPSHDNIAYHWISWHMPGIFSPQRKVAELDRALMAEICLISRDDCRAARMLQKKDMVRGFIERLRVPDLPETLLATRASDAVYNSRLLNLGSILIRILNDNGEMKEVRRFEEVMMRLEKEREVLGDILKI